MTEVTRKGARRKTMASAARGDLIFYCLMSLFPVAQFCVFYIGVNFNSFLLSFKNYDMLTGVSTWVGFDNIVRAFNALFTDSVLIVAAKNSLIAYAVSLLVGVPLRSCSAIISTKSFF